jgi:hypothetical protein
MNKQQLDKVPGSKEMATVTPALQPIRPNLPLGLGMNPVAMIYLDNFDPIPRSLSDVEN